MIIKYQKGRGKKIHLLVDAEYKITTDVDFWSEYGVPNGTEIDENEWQTLVSDINYRKAFNKAADLLSRRSHSAFELKNKLLKTVDLQSAEKAVEKFTELGYLNDEDFAEELSEYLFKTKKYSRNRVKQELIRRGIDREIIYRVLSEDDTDAAESIISIINKSYLRKLGEEGGKQKVVAALMRKGFSYSDIKTAFYRMENE